jgi:PAS domain S-box-containing protein
VTPRGHDEGRVATARGLIASEASRLAASGEADWYYVLFESAADAYLVTDIRGVVREANRSAEVLFGVSRRYLLGKPIGVFLGSADTSFYSVLGEAQRGGHVRDRMLGLARRTGERFVVSVNVGAVVAAGPGRLLWAVRDATEQHRYEEELARRVRERTRELERATRAKDEVLREFERRSRVEREFVANAAHELRTPLAAMVGALDVLQAGAKDVPAERDRFLRHLVEHCSRLHRLTYALLVLARAQMSHEPLATEPVELRPLLQRAATEVTAAPGVRVRVRCRSGLAVLANPDLLEQAVANVATNAGKFVETGEIVLAARRDGGARIVVEIADTGPGMSREEQERAFERFYRADEDAAGGFGLGLAIARQAIETLGGSIGLRSQSGVGTTVAMWLAAAPR